MKVLEIAVDPIFGVDIVFNFRTAYKVAPGRGGISGVSAEYSPARPDVWCGRHSRPTLSRQHCYANVTIYSQQWGTGRVCRAMGRS
eukprot:1882820-Pyramimonas_sp.AAC.1